MALQLTLNGGRPHVVGSFPDAAQGLMPQRSRDQLWVLAQSAVGTPAIDLDEPEHGA